MAKKKKEWNLQSKLVPKIREVWRFSPARMETIKRCKIDSQYYKCEWCKNKFEVIKVDHINPVIDPKTGFKDWNNYINRMFCDAEMLQGLCITCHKKKTKQENELRKKKK